MGKGNRLQLALFLSTYTNKIDKKGRVSVPASFRAAVKEEVFPGIIAFRSFKHQAIECCTYERMEKLSQSVDHMDAFSEAQDDFTASIFADAKELMFDSDGRVVMPKALLDHGNITDRATFVGRGATFQIWQAEAFEAFENEARTRIREAKATLKIRQDQKEKGD